LLANDVIKTPKVLTCELLHQDIQDKKMQYNAQRRTCLPAVVTVLWPLVMEKRISLPDRTRTERRYTIRKKERSGVNCCEICLYKQMLLLTFVLSDLHTLT